MGPSSESHCNLYCTAFGHPWQPSQYPHGDPPGTFAATVVMSTGCNRHYHGGLRGHLNDNPGKASVEPSWDFHGTGLGAFPRNMSQRLPYCLHGTFNGNAYGNHHGTFTGTYWHLHGTFMGSFAESSWEPSREPSLDLHGNCDVTFMGFSWRPS